MKNPLNMKTIVERYEDCERLKSLGVFMPLTHSEKTDLMCPKLYSMSYIEQLNKETKSDVLVYGIAYHELIENVLKTIMISDSLPSLDIVMETIEGLVYPILYREIQSESQQMAIDDMANRIIRSFEGWFENWKKEIHPYYRIQGVELVVAMPIKDHRGKPFLDSIPIIKEGDDYRPARINESSAEPHQIPFYRIGKIDALIECRETGDLYILDHKTAGSISSYAKKFIFDTQMVSYAACMRWEIEHGNYQQFKGKKLKGVIWDLINSKPPNVPKPLKSGKLSKAMSKAPPSYIFKRAIEEHGFDLEDYQDHLETLKNDVDKNHNHCLTQSISDQEMDRSTREDYGHARIIATLRTNLANIEDEESIDYFAPRLPHCSRFGSCKLGSECLSGESPSRSILSRRNRVRWENNEEKEKPLF